MFSPVPYLESVRMRGYKIYSTVVMQHGRLLFQHHAVCPERRLQHSVSKSFTGMAVGLALAENKLSPDTTLGSCFGEGLPGSCITLHDLLTMSSGHGTDLLSLEKRTALAKAHTDWVGFYMSRPLCRKSRPVWRSTPARTTCRAYWISFGPICCLRCKVRERHFKLRY